MTSFYDKVPPVRLGGRQLVGRVAFGFMVLAATLLGAFAGVLVVYSTDLPEVGQLETFRPSSITELYDDQGRVVASFALQRRVVATYDEFPQVLRDAILSIEDKNFDSHWGISFWRMLGAAYKDIRTGSRAQGASTLTMQLSRNLFLTQDRVIRRKIEEIMLAIQIERRFTKPQIFTMYANQIFLGHGVYGFEAGAQYYFGKRAKELTLEEAALLAGLPKAPNNYSPLANLERSTARRNLVINAMLEDGKITVEQAARAKAAPVALNIQRDPNSFAPYFAEEIRRYLEKKYGSSEVHEGGLRVYTSLNSEMQSAANKAALDGLAAYERRHGWRGNLPNLQASGEDMERYRHYDWNRPLESGGYVHAVVTDVGKNSATVRFDRYHAELLPADIAWTGVRSPRALLKVGDVIYVRIRSLPLVKKEADVSLEQEPRAQSALLALDNLTGDIKAMVGGWDFEQSRFNRATQALRQVGSSFKPYVYAAALEEGASPEDTILDAPVAFPTTTGVYRPRNYDGRYAGTVTLRHALAQSRNIPALKLADRVGIAKVIDYARRFGITSKLPAYLPLALGSAEVTLLEQTSAYTTFPNDGVRVAPRYILKVTDAHGNVLEENYSGISQAISPRTARQMTSILRQVVQQGTATAARKLNHPLGGKTGTTNDYTDAWFVGFSPSITCGVWVGFDEKRSLGTQETGGHAALPIWIDFMRVALKGREGEAFVEPAAEPRAPVARMTVSRASQIEEVPAAKR
ncbi:MAG: penicillin-binding protein 1A [Candidatus Korobacteraceae bacterium]